MFNFGSSLRDLCEDKNLGDTSDDEYFSSIESDHEDENDEFSFDDFRGGYDSDDSSFGESEDYYNNVDDDNDDDNFCFTFGDTITKALILWAIAFGISHTALSALLLILRRFGHNELPKLARTLLHTPRKAVKPRPCGPGQIFYRGIQYYMDQYNDEFLLESDTVNIDFFIDGLSLSDSSKVKMWPILGSFVNQPTVQPFATACYSGYADPEDPDDFMREFVDELKHLKESGIYVTKNRILKKFRFRCFICDAPASSFAKGIMSHSSYVGCPKCDQICCSEGHKLYYQFFVGELRTDESFRERKDIMHHKPKFQYRHLLLEEVIGMVSQVALEAMHAIDLGVTKKFSTAIFLNDTVCSHLSNTALSLLKSRFTSFRAYVPTEFARKPRSVNEVARFKATEFRQMLLYTLPVLLKNIVSPQLYSHVLKIHVAVRLLSDPNKYKGNINAARMLINEFVDQYDNTIGKQHFTYYTHCLLHIPDYVEEYGPLYSWSAYKYENHMRVIKRLLRRKHGHIQQFFNRIEEMRFANELESNDQHRKKSKFNEFNLKAKSLRDGCCMVEPGYPLVITSSFIQNGLEFVRGYRYMECTDFYDDPLPSMENMGILLASNLNTTEEDFLVSTINHKFFRLPFEDKFVLIPLLHLATSSNTHFASKNTDLQHSNFPNQSKIKLKSAVFQPKIQKIMDVENETEEDLHGLLKTATNVVDGCDLQIYSSEDHNFAIPFGVPKRSHKTKLLKPVPIHTVSSGNNVKEKFLPIEDGRINSKQSRIQPTILKKKSKIGFTNGPHLKKDNQPTRRNMDQFSCGLMPKTATRLIGNDLQLPPISRIIGKSDVIPLPSSWKSSITTPIVQTEVHTDVISNDSQVNDSILTPQIQRRKINFTSTHITKHGNQDEVGSKPFADLSNTSLKALKGRPWSRFIDSSNSKLPLNVNNSTISIPKSDEANKKAMIKVPSDWKLVPIPKSAIGNFSSILTPKQQSVSTRVHSAIKITDHTLNEDLSTPKPFKPNQVRKNVENEENIPSSRMILNIADDECEQPHAKKQKSYDNEDDKYKVILEKLDKMSKREARNCANIKAIVRKLTEEEHSETFSLPLREENELDRFEDCISKPRFTHKLVEFLKKKIMHSTPDTIVSQLVEAIFHEKLLFVFTVYGQGHGGKRSFEKLKINQIFLNLSKIESKLYYYDLTKVINKMHQRYTRHHHEY